MLIGISAKVLDKKIANETPFVKIVPLSVLQRLEVMNKPRMPM